jgi:hypothetical protein
MASTVLRKELPELQNALNSELYVYPYLCTIRSAFLSRLSMLIKYASSYKCHQ